MKRKNKRNWSLYNQRLKKVASVDFFISQKAIDTWYYEGRRLPGGKQLYSDHVIEACLMLREYFSLPLRQTQGFIESLLRLSSIKDVSVPDYTTLSRRCGKLKINFSFPKRGVKELIVAIDSTGLTVYDWQEWYRTKHEKSPHSYFQKWRKLHVVIDVSDGTILNAICTNSRRNDGQELPSLLDSLDCEIDAVCADMAYDSTNCREAVYRKKAKQLIPPRRQAKLCTQKKLKDKPALKERNEAIEFIKENTVNGDKSRARKLWKENVGYHARSLVETTMSQIKAHTTDRLTNRNEQNRINQALIKCKVVNKIIHA